MIPTHSWNVAPGPLGGEYVDGLGLSGGQYENGVAVDGGPQVPYHYTPDAALRGIAADDPRLQETWQTYMNSVRIFRWSFRCGGLNFWLTRFVRRFVGRISSPFPG